MQTHDASAIAFELNSVAIHLVRLARTADKELHVPPGQLSALSVLVFGGQRTVTELAVTEQVTSPTMTRIVDGLERAGLARRHSHPGDRRSSVVRATAKGRRIMERGRRQRVETIASLLERMPARDLGAVECAANALARALAQHSLNREGP
ncbi:MAG TPA: MarR family transcriptional regulator [Acidimicrobiales bacterium]|nr:MarR family transcriptional regulator [Acidimicrobiales bacterium]